MPLTQILIFLTFCQICFFLSLYIYICIYVCMYAYVYIYMYMYIVLKGKYNDLFSLTLENKSFTSQYLQMYSQDKDFFTY